MKILLLGAEGQVGSEIEKIFAGSVYQITSHSRKNFDLSETENISIYLNELNVDLVINAAAYTAVDKAENESELAFKINAFAVEKIANYCEQRAIPLIHFSTDYVFDGELEKGYQESDKPNPQTSYGKSKLLAEEFIAAHLTRYIILRVSWVFGKQGSNFVKTILKIAREREEVAIVADQWGRPTSAKDLARVVFAIVTQLSTESFNDWGIYHYAGLNPTNWYNFAETFINLAKKMGYPLALKKLNPIGSTEYKSLAKRPKNSVLTCNKISEKFNINCHFWFDYLPEVIDGFFKQEEKNDLLI